MRAGLVGVLLVGMAALTGCSTSAYGIKGDTWIEDCDTLTMEVARIRKDMPKEEVIRILGLESWVLSGSIGVDDVYRQLVVYNYNADCLKLRGKAPPSAQRQLMIEYANEAVSRIVDRPVNQRKSRRSRN